MGNCKILVEKRSSLNNVGFPLVQEKMFLITLKSIYFQQKLQIKFQNLNQQYSIHLNQNIEIRNLHLNSMEIFWIKLQMVKANINTGILNEYFKYHNSSSLVKDIYNANETRKENIGNDVNDTLIDLQLVP